MNPLGYKNYRTFLIELCEANKSLRGFQSQLSKAAGCQASYFSQVLKGKVHLTEDQVFGISEHLDFTEVETSHFLLLLRYEKAGTQKLKKFLADSIEKSLKHKKKLGQEVPAEKIIQKEDELGLYFQTWIPSAVHLLTSSDQYSDTKKIAVRLGLNQELVDKTLKLLLQLGVVQKQGRKWVYAGSSMHLPKTSPWQPQMQAGRRQLALRSIEQNPEDSIHFSSLFTMAENEIEELRKICAQFTKKSHKVIGRSAPDELYCICLDYFKVVQ